MTVDIAVTCSSPTNCSRFESSLAAFAPQRLAVFDDSGHYPSEVYARVQRELVGYDPALKCSWLHNPRSKIDVYSSDIICGAAANWNRCLHWYLRQASDFLAICSDTLQVNGNFWFEFAQASTSSHFVPLLHGSGVPVVGTRYLELKRDHRFCQLIFIPLSVATEVGYFNVNLPPIAALHDWLLRASILGRQNLGSLTLPSGIGLRTTLLGDPVESRAQFTPFSTDYSRTGLYREFALYRDARVGGADGAGFARDAAIQYQAVSQPAEIPARLPEN